MNSYLTAALLVLTAPLSSLLADEHPSHHLQQIAEFISPRNIQILLEKETQEALLEVKGPYYIFNPHDGAKVASGLLGKRFMIRALENGLKWGEEFPGIHQIYIKPRSEETAIFINGVQYGGAIAIYAVAGKIHVVNDLDIEEYVKAVLTQQFTAPLEPEVLSALAILTRTDAYHHATRSEQSFWHVAASDVHYQGSALVVTNSAIERAVDTTKHLILVHRMDGKDLPFPTTWTEHSAGKTASYQAIFRKESTGPDRGVPTPHAALCRQETKWSHAVSKKALANLLGLESIKSMELFIDSSSGKVYGARVKSANNAEDFDFFTLQQALGANHLLSNDFTINVKEDVVLFNGFGKGHGVGLCLYSASALAQNGENAVKILHKFFPETQLYNLNLVR